MDTTIYEAFCERLAEKVRDLKTGDPADNVYTGPVINQAAHQRVLSYIQLGRQEGRLLVFADIQPASRLAQEEIFGPVLSVIRAADFDDALRIANDTEYGLTGAIYSGSREYLNRASAEFHVGNLYLNRKCTGAMVGAHPFGGFNMSGTDSKAGGPDYLTLFTQAKSVAEKVGVVSARAEEQEERMGL